ncbi:hypothetical protein, partial [Streptomyces sp. NPDC002346]
DAIAADAAAVPVAVTADQQPTCGAPTADDFPITTRIRGGQETYASGGGYGTWFLDLTNTTSKPCSSIHPVLVLTDEDQKLTSDQIQLEFSDPDSPDLPHRVTWETTDRDEHIGVFGGDGADGADTFDGFTVPAGRTVSVQVRMAFTSDTDPNRITAKAAIVQRKQAAPADGAKETPAGDDGDWVGESDDYVFGVVEDDTGGGDTGDEDTGGTGDVGGISREGDVLPEPSLDSATPGIGDGGVDGGGVVGGSGDTGGVDGGGVVGGSGDTGGVDGGGVVGGSGDTGGVGGGGVVGGSGDTGGVDGGGVVGGSGDTGGVGGGGVVGGSGDTGGVGGGGVVRGSGDVGGVDGGGDIGGSGDTPSPRGSGEVPSTARDPQDQPELARTGPGAVIWTEGVVAVLCLAGGVAAVRGARRLRRTRR